MIKNHLSNRTHSDDPSKTHTSFNPQLNHIVVVGASHAGISFADQIRKNGFSGTLTVIDRQKGGPVERPPLSKGFLLDPSDKINPAILLKKAKWYRSQNISLKHSVNVINIDATNKQLLTSNGEEINYDKLVLATGALPRFLPSSKNISNVFVLRQPDDAIALRNTARKAKRAIVIGGGYIGLEVAASLRQLGLVVNVIELANRLLARVASPPVAQLLEELHRRRGVSIFTGTGIDKILEEDNTFRGVVLSDGTLLSAEMLIIGIGVTPDSHLAKLAGIETERPDGGAILVDERMHTSDPSILSIGDVALERGNSLRIESVHNAQESAARAASAIMGTTPPLIQAPWFWSDQFDASLQSVGIIPTAEEGIYQITRAGNREGGVSFWSYRNQELIAVEAVKDPKNYMIGKKCLETKISPNPDLIGNLDFNPLD